MGIHCKYSGQIFRYTSDATFFESHQITDAILREADKENELIVEWLTRSEGEALMRVFCKKENKNWSGTIKIGKELGIVKGQASIAKDIIIFAGPCRIEGVKTHVLCQLSKVIDSQ
jgi:hypothetical protein